VGDGLVAQIPAILISTAAGMLVTRSTAEASFGEELASQFLGYPRVLMLTAGLLFLLGLVPGFAMLLHVDLRRDAIIALGAMLQGNLAAIA